MTKVRIFHILALTLSLVACVEPAQKGESDDGSAQVENGKTSDSGDSGTAGESETSAEFVVNPISWDNPPSSWREYTLEALREEIDRQHEQWGDYRATEVTVYARWKDSKEGRSFTVKGTDLNSVDDNEEKGIFELESNIKDYARVEFSYLSGLKNFGETASYKETLIVTVNADPESRYYGNSIIRAPTFVRDGSFLSPIDRHYRENQFLIIREKNEDLYDFQKEWNGRRVEKRKLYRVDERTLQFREYRHEELKHFAPGPEIYISVRYEKT